MNPLDNILNQAISNLQNQNELEAAKAKIKRLEERVASLDKACSTLREAGDDLWYCLRHRNEDPAEAISEWTEVRDV
jgi:chromosome segregation ATPase